ncbi:MAG: ribonuclease III [bacterium]|nr:ribonuclease III [bacterium]
MLNEFFGENADNKLLKKALTHPSFTKEKGELDSLENYERLEFFGDSVLKLYTSKLLYELYPEYPEGKLSKIRSILVSDYTLHKIALQIGLEKLIILGKAEAKQGGRYRESNLACSLEAILGAYYLSGKGNCVEHFIEKYLLPFAKDIDEHFEKYNAKDVLQQYTQGIDKTLPEYKTISMEGPAHKPVFEIGVYWHGEMLAVCKGSSKKETQQECAYEACKKLGVI